MVCVCVCVQQFRNKIKTILNGYFANNAIKLLVNPNRAKEVYRLTALCALVLKHRHDQLVLFIINTLYHFTIPLLSLLSPHYLSLLWIMRHLVLSNTQLIPSFIKLMACQLTWSLN